MIILEFKIQKLVFISHINLATIRPFIEKIRVINTSKEKKSNPIWFDFCLAGETRFEHATYGFGDRYSTVEPLP